VLSQLIHDAQGWQDTEYADYASQHLATVTALEGWLDECRRVYYPWMHRMQRVNSDYARRVGIMGVCEEIERRRDVDLQHLPDITIQEVPSFTYDTRCGQPDCHRPQSFEHADVAEPGSLSAQLLARFFCKRVPACLCCGVEHVDQGAAAGRSAVGQ
jgi:hypothetical protein